MGDDQALSWNTLPAKPGSPGWPATAGAQNCGYLLGSSTCARLFETLSDAPVACATLRVDRYQRERPGAMPVECLNLS
jgi:hypothetical protein